MLWKVIVSLWVEADDEDEAISEACRLDNTAIVESITCLTPEVRQQPLETDNENDETDP